MDLEQCSIHAWIQKNELRGEQGQLIDFKNHYFLFDIYRDFSPKQVAFKAAQVGFSTLAINKTLWIAKHRQMNVIYTLPTEKDVSDFVGGKVNRIIAQNPVLQEWVRDRDSIEQKRIGNSVMYWRGTWTQKAAIMVSSDLNVYDEVDSSKQDVVEQYSTRLQHSKYKWEWYFSHPSAPGTGVDRYWPRSDQKHWFVKCRKCGKWQYMEWPKSVDLEKRIYVCKICHAELKDHDRKYGQWVAKHKDKEYSGYWIPLLICPWVKAGEIVDYYNNKSEEYFWNKVLGLPYVGGGNKLTKSLFMQNLTDKVITPERGERVIIGVDTGKKLHYVCGGKEGMFYYDYADDYDEIEKMLKRWPKAIAVIDQGGDIIGPRKLREKYPGRVFLCLYREDRKTMELISWGQRDEVGAVVCDRNRMIQLVVDEFSERRIPVQGTENDWYDYWLHWNNLTRIKEVSPHEDKVKRIWVRSGDDHWAHATIYWRVGMSRFSETANIIHPDTMAGVKESPVIYDQRMPAPDPQKSLDKLEDEDDWRISY